MYIKCNSPQQESMSYSQSLDKLVIRMWTSGLLGIWQVDVATFMQFMSLMSLSPKHICAVQADVQNYLNCYWRYIKMENHYCKNSKTKTK